MSAAVGATPGRLRYNSGLDGLRAIAVFGVLFQHGNFTASAGYQGVTVFFVLSGYLITTLLAVEFDGAGTIHFRRFYLRRLARLGPALVLVILATELWFVVTNTQLEDSWEGLIGSATYTTDLFLQFQPHAAVGGMLFTWTLGVEEQFYLLWPLALLVLLRRGRFVETMVLFGILIAGCWAFRDIHYDAAAGLAGSTAYQYGPFTHVDALLLGCAVALILRRVGDAPALRVASPIAAAVGVLGLVLCFGFPALPVVFDQFGLTALMSAFVVFAIAAAPTGVLGRVLSARPLPFLGRISYGIYLWNVLLITIFIAIFGQTPHSSLWGAGWLFAVVAVAYLSNRFVEVPLRRRIEAWADRGSVRLTDAPVRGVGAEPT